MLPGTYLFRYFRVQNPILDCFIQSGNNKEIGVDSIVSFAHYIKNEMICFSNTSNPRIKDFLEANKM